MHGMRGARALGVKLVAARGALRRACAALDGDRRYQLGGSCCANSGSRHVEDSVD